MTKQYTVAGDLVDWMAGIGIGFNTMGNYESATQYGASTPYLAPGCYEGGAGYAMMFMAQRVEKYEKGKIIYSTSVTDLIKDESGRVVGFHAKGEEFADIIKMGRTQLQDAVPMTLGQEFEAYAATLTEEIDRLKTNMRLFYEINMGATAIGTGINADPDYAELCTKHLREITGLPLTKAANMIEATSDTGAFIMNSSALKRLAVKLSKICNDLRLLSSGPRCGLNEINLPPRQPGSSIMPGKVNPVIPEVVNQVAFRVIGNDLAITLASEAGQLELNVMEPIIVLSLFENIEMLSMSSS